MNAGKVASGPPESNNDGVQEERKWCLTRDRGTGLGQGSLSLRPKVGGHLELSLRSRLDDSSCGERRNRQSRT